MTDGPIDDPITWQDRAHNARLEEKWRTLGRISGFQEWDAHSLDRRFADLPERDKAAVFRLRGLGFVLLRENEDVSDLINEPHFIDWVRWALSEGPLKDTVPKD